MTLEEALAKIADLEKSNGDLQARLTTAEGRVTNAEALIGRHSKEVGDLRKENETLKGQAAKAVLLETELNELKAKGGVTPAGGQQEEPDVDELESGITEDQQKILDAAFERATPEQKLKIANDKTVRAAFLKQAIERAAPVPVTWRKPQRKADDGRGGGGAGMEDIKALFDFSRRKPTQPIVPRSAGVREAAGRVVDERAGRSILNPNDVSGSLRRSREQRKKE